MRCLTACCLVILSISPLALTAETPKKSKNATKEILPPKSGVKTPGVQIPFSSLKAENEFAISPEWVFASDAILVPNRAKDELERIDAKAFKLGDPITGLSKPCGGAVNAFNSLWTATCGDHSLVRLDVKTGKVTATIATGVSSASGILAASTDSIWLLSDDKSTLSRIDPQANKVVAEIRLPAGCGSLTFGEGSLWAACPSEDRILRIEPMTNLVDKRIEVSAQPVSLALGEGSVWVLSKKDGKVDRIDPKTNKVIKTIDLNVPDAAGSIATGQGSIWVTLAGYPLTRIDPLADKEKVVQQFWGEGGGAVYFTAGSLWLSDTHEGKLLRIDPKRVAATLAE